MKLLNFGDSDPLSTDDSGFYTSFADMMTLLMVFFVLMFSVSKPDESKFDQVAKSVSQAFNQEVAQEIIDEVNRLEVLEKSLNATIEAVQLSDQISTEVTPDGLKLELASSALFAAGSAEIRQSMKATLKQLSGAILTLPSEEYMMRIEGHTDDVPISTARFPSNWELASARALNVLHLFEANGFPSDQLAATSYADTQPKLPNRSATGEALTENQAKNRRVLVYIKPRT
ncbi:MAG: flagellar motor protein MotB [Pseudomonadales bacterium]|nr:flagellar motor protein MotB [Pseudomonadales bacterium]